jgi:cytochrome P450
MHSIDGTVPLRGLPDLFQPEILEEPSAWYRDALAAGPVFRAPDGTHVVLSYALVSEAADRPGDFSNEFGHLMSGARREDAEISAISAQGWPVVNTMLTADDPVHARFRRLVSLAFTMPRVNALEAHIRDIAVALLQQLPPGEGFDFLAGFAVPLPVRMIAGQIGLELADAPKVKQWSDASVARHSGLASRERELQSAREMLEFQRFIKDRIDQRRAGGNTGDLLGAVVNARIEGERPLEDAEIMSVIQQLMVAGNETTTSTLAGGMLLLIQNPEQMAKVRAAPALIPNMVEEMLRLLSPTAGMWRIATRDTTLGDARIAAGDWVMLRFAAANRDPSVFDDPDRFDVERRNARQHMAFGRGLHVCIGNMLARKEVAVAFEEILKRFGDIRLADETHQPRHWPHKLLCGLADLDVVLR